MSANMLPERKLKLYCRRPFHVELRRLPSRIRDCRNNLKQLPAELFEKAISHLPFRCCEFLREAICPKVSA
jgi:hypothetical protein